MKRITYLTIALLFAMLLPQYAVLAAEKETVILTAEKEKAAVEIEIPDNSEGVSTLRLRVRIEGDTEYLDSAEPVKFVSGENLNPMLLETRYNADKGYFTIYLSDTKKITDKSLFLMGYLVPNVSVGKQGSLTISVEEDGLEYVAGTGRLNDEINVQSSTIVLNLDQAGENSEDNPGNSDGGSTGSDSDGLENDTTGGASGGTNGGTTGGVSDGTNGGTTDELINAAAGGSGTDGDITTEADNVRGGGANTGEVIIAAQTGDSTSIAPFCVMTVLSASAVLSVLTVQKAKKRRNRK